QALGPAPSQNHQALQQRAEHLDAYLARQLKPARTGGARHGPRRTLNRAHNRDHTERHGIRDGQARADAHAWADSRLADAPPSRSTPQNSRASAARTPTAFSSPPTKRPAT